MGDLSIDLRRCVVDAYLSQKSGTYEQTAVLFKLRRSSELTPPLLTRIDPLLFAKDDQPI